MARSFPDGDTVPDGCDVFAADPEVGRDLAAVDWAATPLGPPSGWPQSLRTAVSILLSSRFAMWMAWGPELTFFCNDAYRHDTLGQKYPWALGRPAREVWAEVWSTAGPRIETVLTSGRATWDEGLQLFLERSGYPEETYHTFSYSPLRDEAGAVVGMLCVVTEETERVIGERRMATLRDLGSDPSVVRTEQQMLDFAAQQLGRNPQDLPFTLTYLFDDGPDDETDSGAGGETDSGAGGEADGPDGTGDGPAGADAGPDGTDGTAGTPRGRRGARLACASGIEPGHPAAPRRLPPGALAPWPAAGPADGPLVVDLATLPRPSGEAPPLPTGVWEEPPTGALLVPLPRQGGEPYGFLVAALNRYRPLDEDYRSFLDLVAGHVAAGIGSARSYRAQQRRAEELAELDRAKTAFFHNVSHEFRTPLTLIMGPLEELRGRLEAADPRIREELDVAHRNGLRMGRLVNTLLDFSQIEAGRMRAAFAPVDLAATTADLAGVFRSAAERAGLTLEVDCPPLDEPVHLDRSMWEKVVLNLLGNALKFTFDGGLRVAVRRDGDHAVVTFADTGVGIPAAEMSRLFDRFHRIRTTRARSHEGSGIGLALVKELVQLHGGAITADSTEGRGTVFTVRLRFGTAHLPPGSLVPATAASVMTDARPYVQEALGDLSEEAARAPGHLAAEVRESGVTPALAAGRTAGARVLVADDNADLRGYLTRLLTGAGYRVRAVGDGAAALEAARAAPPDLVVGDVMMPGMDGLALVAALRADSRTAAVPVLLLSARAGQEASIEGLEAGADDYLVKPFAAAELLARVRAAIELARIRGRNARWRAALVDALQEAFFVCDEDGTLLEANSAFTEILGYGPDDLPGPPRPGDATGREAHERWTRAFRDALSGGAGRCDLPVERSDGQRIWLAVSCNGARDPDTGRRIVVGTFRDVTAEQYAVQRDATLAALGLRLSQATGPGEALADALDELRRVWRAGQVLAVVFGDRPEPCVAAVGEGAVDSWARLPEDDRAALTALRDHPALTPVAEGNRAHVVLEHPEGPLVLRVDLGARRPFTPEDRLLLSLLAGRIAQGLTRIHQADQDRRTALALQRSILGPARLPRGFAVRYEPAVPPLEVGGDWYDTVALPDGRTGIVVGDCVGRGLEAATVMGQLRSACRALLLQEAGPARTLAALDHFAAGVPGALCTTLFCGVLDPETGRLVYAGAGHPPGILVGPDGGTTLLDQGRSLPLAVRPGAERPEAECVVPPRSTLLLYTDGLVERRRRPLSEGIRLAAEALEEGRDLPADQLAARVMDRLAPEDGYDDDVALLLYRHPGPLELTFPADSSQLATTRGTLRGWLQRCGLPPGLAQKVLVAAGEACANAVEHGHRDRPGGPVRLSAAATADEIHLVVEDSGRWKPPEPGAAPFRGRGLALMRAMMQEVSVAPGGTGTTVRMWTRIAG